MPKLLDLDDHIIGLDRFDAHEQDLKDAVHSRLQERTEIDFRTGCAIYTGAWEKSGQAKMRVGRLVYPITRVSAWLYLGFALWDVRRVGHKSICPHPACYAQEHLVVLVDQAASLAAQRRYGRLGMHHRRLSKDKAREIRLLAGEGVPLTAIAAMPAFDVGFQAIRAVVEGRTWKHE